MLYQVGRNSPFVKGAFAIMLFTVSLSFAPANSLQAGIKSLSHQSIGAIDLQKDSAEKGDFIVATFMDSLYVDPIFALKFSIFLPQSDVKPLAGCLSVAQLNLHSGKEQLNQPGVLTFGCSDVPKESKVYGWIDGNWTPVPAIIDDTGTIKIEFTDLTTYAIFPTNPKPLEAI